MMGRKRARSDASEVFKKKSKPGLQNRKLFAKILSALHALKIFVFYFCIPFTIALLLALFFTSPRPKLSNELADWRDSGYTYEYEGFEIFYQDIHLLKPSRAGQDLLLLHGFPTSSYDWKKVIFSLVGRFRRIVAIDMLGFGFSDKPFGHNYTVLEQALMHEKLLNHLGISNVHILAHDLGDTVAQEMLARFADRNLHDDAGLVISSLCLTNGGIFPETHHQRFAQKLLRAPVIGEISAYLMNYVFFKYSFAAIFGYSTQPTSKELWDFWTLIRYNDGHLVAPRQLRYIDERVAHRERWVGALENAKIPLHYIYGALDPINPEVALQRYRTLLKHSTITVLSKVGHYPHWEDRKEFLKGYNEFLDGIGVK